MYEVSVPGINFRFQNYNMRYLSLGLISDSYIAMTRFLDELLLFPLISFSKLREREGN